LAILWISALYIATNLSIYLFFKVFLFITQSFGL